MIPMNIIIWILQYLHFSSVLSMIHSDHLTILTMDIIFYRFTLTPFFFFFHTNRILHAYNAMPVVFYIFLPRRG